MRDSLPVGLMFAIALCQMCASPQNSHQANGMHAVRVDIMLNMYSYIFIVVAGTRRPDGVQ